MPLNENIDTWAEIRSLLENDNGAGLRDCIDSLSPSEAIRAIYHLSSEEREKILTTLAPEDAAELVEEMPDEHAADLIEQLDPADAAAILSEMHSDDQADVLGNMVDTDAEAILSEMDAVEAEEARKLASYEPDTAGGLMQTEFLRFFGDDKIGDVVQELRHNSEHYQGFEIRYLYVVSRTGELIGVVPLNRLIFTYRERPLSEVMLSPESLRDDTPQNDIVEFFEKHNWLGVPVVDDRRRLIGVVVRTAIETATLERAEADLMKTQGIVSGDEIRSMPTLTRSWRRLSWLSINIFLNLLAASVIALYEETIAAVIALAVFLPIVSDMSGCSGNQAVAVSLRELTLGYVKPREIFRVLLKEFWIGVINGVALGVFLGIAAYFWKGNAVLGLVVGGALALNTLLAVSIGGTVPLLLKRFRVDPAVASSPILTTLTDMMGFFLVLSFATLGLAYLK